MKFSALGYNVAIVTRDAVSVHREFARRHKIAFTLLADEKVEIIEAYDMANPQYEKGSAWYGIAQHAIFVIDPKGTLTHRFTTDDYRDRPSPEAVLAVLQKAAGS